jgi:hypothetical protein
VLHHLRAEATEADGVVAGVLVSPEVHPDLAGWAAVNAAEMAAMGAGVVVLPGTGREELEVMLGPEEVRGALLLEGEGGWIAGKPALVVDLLGFEGEVSEEIEVLAADIAGRSSDGTSLEGYSVAYASGDAVTLDDLIALEGALGGGVELLRADVLVEVLRRDVAR